MGSNHLSEEEVSKFLRASEDLMTLGMTFSRNIDVALGEFKQTFELIMKSHYVEKAVAELLSDSFDKLKEKVNANLESIDSIYTEGGQWYTFYFGRVMGRQTTPPSPSSLIAGQEKAKAQTGS